MASKNSDSMGKIFNISYEISSKNTYDDSSDDVNYYNTSSIEHFMFEV